jgi:iron complex outermembrane receptor protein
MDTKKIIILLLTILATGCINTLIAAPPLKGNLSGTVKDIKTGLPIEGVSVYITDIKSGGYTNQKGEFFIASISDGIHLVEISHIGYSTIAEKIAVNGDTKKEFLLAESVIENNAVIVTGVTNAIQLKKAPFQVSVMRKEELQQTVSTNIIEAITKKPGVSSLATGPAISKPLIRGLGYNRVLTVNDGVRQEGQQWGDEHGIEIDEASVNKIEILKGPASLVYGSDAMAGVINIITNVPVQINTLKINVGSNYQTNNHLSNIYGNFAGNVHGFNWNVYGTVKAAGDYKNKYDGYVFNSKFNEHNIGGYAGYNGGWGYSHLILSNFNLKTGLIEGEPHSMGFFIKPVAGGGTVRATEDDFKSTNPAIPFQHITHFKFATDNSFKIGKNRLSVNVAWQHNQRQEFGNIDVPDQRSLYFDLKTVTYNTQFHFKEKAGWRTSIGINGMNQENINLGVQQLIPDYSLNDIGGFGFFQKEIKNLTVSGGLRFDTRNVDVKELLEGGTVKGMAFSKNFSNFSGSIGSTYEIVKGINLKLNIARAFRAPSIPELASKGSHEGTNRYEYGNRDLNSEISTQFDASIGYTSQHFSVDVAGYYNYFGNFIFYHKLQSERGVDSIVYVNGEALTAFNFDQQATQLAGFETHLDIHPHPLDWLHIENTFSYVSGKFKEPLEGSDNLPFIPASKLFTELRADFKKLASCLKNSYVKFEIENNFRKSQVFTGYNTETPTPGYTLLNAGIGTEITNKKSKVLCSMNFSVNNIADIAYQNHLSRLKYAPQNLATGRNGVYNMGRNFSIKLNVPVSIVLSNN